MYRPNRIGPHPLAAMGHTVFSITGAQLATDAGVLTGDVQFRVNGAVAPVSVSAENWRVSSNLSMVTVEGVAVGVKITGPSLTDDEEYLVSYGGALSCGVDSGVIGALPVLGRISGAGLETGSLGSFAAVPAQAFMNNGGFLSVSANGTVVLGDFAQSGIDSTDEIFFGFFLMNPGSGTQIFKSMHGSFSLHRYEYDLSPFDPDR